MQQHNPIYRPLRRRHPSQQGFTLLEIMVVIVILGVLASWWSPA